LYIFSRKRTCVDRLTRATVVDTHAQGHDDNNPGSF
jgi:hypothetical protein